MTDYYIDLAAGNDSWDGLSVDTGHPWRTLGKFMSNTRVAGDIAYVRANTTQIPTADITTTTVGTGAAKIQVIGCNATQGIDPWGDASDVRPLIDFDAGAYNMIVSNNWTFKNMKFFDSNDDNGIVYGYNRTGLYFYNCVFSTGVRYCMQLDGVCEALFELCAFDTPGSTYCGMIFTGLMRFISCTFDGKAAVNTYGLRAAPGGIAWLSGCTFGATTTHGTADIGTGAGRFFLRNTKLLSTNQVSASATVAAVFSDGVNQSTDAFSKGTQWLWMNAGQVYSGTAYAKAGGAAQGLRFASNALCNDVSRLQVTYFLYASGTGSVDYTLNAKFTADDLFAADLNQTQLFFTITELKADGTIATSSPGAKTWDYDDVTNWQSMTIAHAAAAAGILRIDVYLAAASGMVDVDPPSGVNAAFGEGGVLWNFLTTSGGGAVYLPHANGVLYMKKNTAVTGFPFSMINKTTGSAITSGTVSAYYTLDGGSQIAIAGSPVHEGNGQWTVDITAGELNGNVVGLTFTHADASPQHFTLIMDTKKVSDLNDITTAQVNTEADTALSDIGLNHLLAASVTGTDITDDSVVAKLVSKSATADWDTFTNTTDSLEAVHDAQLTAAQVNTEADTALSDIGLNHLLAASVTGTDVTDNSIIAKLVSKSATADWDSFVNTTDSLEAIKDGGASVDNAAIADAVWDEATTGHVAAGSFGSEVQTHATAAEVNTQAAAALTTYDPPTYAEVQALLAAAGLTSLVKKSYTVTIDGNPGKNVYVKATSDTGGTVYVDEGYTDDYGHVKLEVPTGTVYLWRSHDDYTFSDPDTEATT